LRHTADDPNLTAAIRVPVALGNVAVVMPGECFQRMCMANGRHDVLGGDNPVNSLAVGVPNIHELDEANDVATPPKMTGEGEDLVLVDASLHHYIDLEAVKAGGNGRVNACQDLFHGDVAPVDRLEYGVVQGV